MIQKTVKYKAQQGVKNNNGVMSKMKGFHKKIATLQMDNELQVSPLQFLAQALCFYYNGFVC